MSGRRSISVEPEDLVAASPRRSLRIRAIHVDSPVPLKNTEPTEKTAARRTRRSQSSQEKSTQDIDIDLKPKNAASKTDLEKISVRKRSSSVQSDSSVDKESKPARRVTRKSSKDISTITEEEEGIENKKNSENDSPKQLPKRRVTRAMSRSPVDIQNPITSATVSKKKRLSLSLTDKMQEESKLNNLDVINENEDEVDKSENNPSGDLLNNNSKKIASVVLEKIDTQTKTKGESSETNETVDDKINDNEQEETEILNVKSNETSDDKISVEKENEDDETNEHEKSTEILNNSNIIDQSVENESNETENNEEETKDLNSSLSQPSENSVHKTNESEQSDNEKPENEFSLEEEMNKSSENSTKSDSDENTLNKTSESEEKINDEKPENSDNEKSESKLQNTSNIENKEPNSSEINEKPVVETNETVDSDETCGTLEISLSSELNQTKDKEINDESTEKEEINNDSTDKDELTDETTDKEETINQSTDKEESNNKEENVDKSADKEETNNLSFVDCKKLNSSVKEIIENHSNISFVENQISANKPETEVNDKSFEENEQNLSLVNDDGKSYSPIINIVENISVEFEESMKSVIDSTPGKNENSFVLSEKSLKENSSNISLKNENVKTPASKKKTKNADDKENIKEIESPEIKSKDKLLEDYISTFTSEKKRKRNFEESVNENIVSSRKKMRKNVTEIDFSESENSDEETKNDFLDDMASEGSESTPSVDSNEIIDEGESIGSSDSELQSDDSDYEHGSFIVDDDEGNEDLLSGNEDDILESSVKSKRKRIISINSDSEENLDEMSTAPFGGSSPSIVSVNHVSSIDSDPESVRAKNEALSKKIEENSQSIEEIVLETSTDNKDEATNVEEDEKAENIITIIEDKDADEEIPEITTVNKIEEKLEIISVNIEDEEKTTIEHTFEEIESVFDNSLKHQKKKVENYKNMLDNNLLTANSKNSQEIKRRKTLGEYPEEVENKKPRRQSLQLQDVVDESKKRFENYCDNLKKEKTISYEVNTSGILLVSPMKKEDLKLEANHKLVGEMLEDFKDYRKEDFENSSELLVPNLIKISKKKKKNKKKLNASVQQFEDLAEVNFFQTPIKEEKLSIKQKKIDSSYVDLSETNLFQTPLKETQEDNKANKTLSIKKKKQKKLNTSTVEPFENLSESKLFQTPTNEKSSGYEENLSAKKLKKKKLNTSVQQFEDLSEVNIFNTPINEKQRNKENIKTTEIEDGQTGNKKLKKKKKKNALNTTDQQSEDSCKFSPLKTPVDKTQNTKKMKKEVKRSLQEIPDLSEDNIFERSSNEETKKSSLNKKKKDKSKSQINNFSSSNLSEETNKSSSEERKKDQNKKQIRNSSSTSTNLSEVSSEEKSPKKKKKTLKTGSKQILEDNSKKRKLIESDNQSNKKLAKIAAPTKFSVKNEKAVPSHSEYRSSPKYYVHKSINKYKNIIRPSIHGSTDENLIGVKLNPSSLKIKKPKKINIKPGLIKASLCGNVDLFEVTQISTNKNFKKQKKNK